jgi:hypothetical protein
LAISHADLNWLDMIFHQKLGSTHLVGSMRNIVSGIRNITKVKLLIRETARDQEKTMRKPAFVRAFLLASLSCAQAQNPAVNTTGRNNADHPVSGANSFREGQARSRIEASGFREVSELNKDSNGVWRGKTKKDGKNVEVSLDFQGNVIAR